MTYKVDKDVTLSFTLIGENEDLPPCLISEFSTKGDKRNPDGIEIYTKDDGNIGGLTLKWAKEMYVFEDRNVKKGEYIAVFPFPGLSANNGSVELYTSASPFSKLMDKVVYTNKPNEDFTSLGWIGCGVDSTKHTATKTFKRKCVNNELLDTDTSDDWYIPTTIKSATWNASN